MFLQGFKIYLSTCSTDLRKSYQGLSVLVQEHFKEDPFEGGMFVFYNRSHDRLKVLYWHLNGFCILQKRLEKGRFVLPRFKEEMAKLEVSFYQLQGLIQGLSCWQGQEVQSVSYRYT